MLRVESKALYVKPSSSFALTASSSSDDDESDSSSNNNNNNCDTDKHNACERDAYADAGEREPLLAGSDNQENAQLQEENARLRRQVADLTSALVVRDMEIASLQERCQLLLASVEQQDEVIAKIYAAAAATGSSSSASAPVLIPTPVNASAVDAHKQRSRHGIATLFASKRDSNSSSHYAKKSLLTNTQRSPGAGATVITVPPATTTLAAEPARELLEAQLESIGYQPQEATHALESLAEGVPLLTRRSSVESAGESASVGMLDRLLFPSPPKSEPLFGTTGSSHLRSTPRSTATSPDVSFGKAHRHTPFLERQTSEEDFAKSAGFLRKANRKLSGRLSVSDFGLLSDDTPLFGRSTSEEPDPTSVDQPEDDGSDASDGSLKRAQSRRTASQRNLFAEIDVAASEDAKRKKQQPASGEKDEDELTYAEFLERIRLPASRDVLNRIRVFVGSILGPRGDGKPPRSSDYVDYDFYGHHEFTRRYERFFRKMDEVLAAHPAWRHASETTLSKARDGIEKYVMDKLSDIAFNQLPVCQQWKTEDDELFRRMKLLSVRSTKLREDCVCVCDWRDTVSYLVLCAISS